MWLIDRNSDGLQTRRIALPPPVRMALVRWYEGVGDHHDEEAGILLVQQARIGEKWIACDCLEEGQPPPILTPAYLSEAETYYLRRLTSAKRPEHRTDCPFFRDQATNRITEVRSPLNPADPPAGFFEVLRPAPQNLAQKPEEDLTDDRTRNASIPRLARLLWRLIDAAGLNHCQPISHQHRPMSIGDEFKALGQAAAKIEIAPGVELASAFWTHAGPLHSKQVYASLRRLSERWPHGHAPQAFLTLFAPAFQGSSIDVPGCDPVLIANRVQSPSVRTNVIKGPYLALVVIGQYPESRGFAPLRAYAQPIYSGRRFVPVDSEFERLVLRQLLEAQQHLNRMNIDLSIEKPVFDRLTDFGPCRPDFMIEARSRESGEVRQLIIEAMGFHDDVYLAAKAVTLPRMQQIAPVLPVTPKDAERRRIGPMLIDMILS
ncbi:hypothetical protein [Sphingobium chungbukense]|uniref:DUF1173 domain-containing protein n=1 Tax=Sphingobium chungbukense TaxID=56193 RepID=A0A0M3AH52_9SPHN|nr:hypothetical protein [Sphingobium chungbukense]KKW89358.1 hypothetical protein YP76_25900 [Sphingobium chungbukense]